MSLPFAQSFICPILVGRGVARGVLEHAISQARNRRGQVILLSGEAGVGKSRLVAEARMLAHGLMTVLQGHCFETDLGLPFACIADMLRTFLAACRSEDVLQTFGP